MRLFKVFFAVLVSLFLVTAVVVAGTVVPADTVLINGKIITVDHEFSIAEAVAVRDGKIAAVGKTQDIMALVGPQTKVIDLDGKTVTPGFIDGHAHMDREGLKYIYPSLEGATTKAQILAAIEAEVQTAKTGEWIITMPIGQPPYYFDALEMLKNGEIPNRWDLDKVAPENPVYIRHIWGYWGQLPLISVANSKALEIAGITAKTLDPWSGLQIVKDLDTGEPNGIFLEWSFVPTLEFNLFKDVPRFTHNHRVNALRKSMEVYNSYGTTAIYEGHGIAPEVIAAYKDLWENDELTVRSYLVISPNWQVSDDISGLLEWATYADGKGFGDDMLKIGGIFVQNGGDPEVAQHCQSASPYTAWAAYLYTAMSEEEFIEKATAVINAGIRFNTIGGNVTRSLDILESISQGRSLQEQRIVLEHLSYVTDDDVRRMKELGVVATTIPVSSLWKGTSLIERAQREPDNVLPLKKMMDAGLTTVLCTDNVPPSMLYPIWTAVTRTNRVTGEAVAPNQALTREQALRAATINGAYLLFAEDKIGSIEPGKFADLVVLEKDILTCPEDEIKDIRVLLTMVGGNIVYQYDGAQY